MLDKTHLSGKKKLTLCPKNSWICPFNWDWDSQKIEGELCQLLFKSPRNMQELWANVSKHQVNGASWEFCRATIFCRYTPKRAWISNCTKIPQRVSAFKPFGSVNLNRLTVVSAVSFRRENLETPDPQRRHDVVSHHWSRMKCNRIEQSVFVSQQIFPKHHISFFLCLSRAQTSHFQDTSCRSTEGNKV